MSRFSAFIDNAIYAFAPVWGARRIETRRQYDKYQAVSDKFSKSYEGSEDSRHREGKWLGSRLSADASLEEDLESARQRSRELYRNDFVGGAIDSRVEHVVGTGFTVQSRIKAKEGVLTEDDAQKLNAELEDLFEQIEPTLCRTRKKSLWQKICLADRCIDADGETFVVMSDIGGADLPIPLCIEIVDCDRIESPPEKTGDPLCRMGIQYNAEKQIIGYHIRKAHPYDNKEFSVAYDFIPAWRVLHVFIEWFAGQSRGLPWMTRALNRAKDGKDLTEAGIIGAQVEACFAGFIKSKVNPVAAAMGAATTTDNGQRIQEVRPGSMNYIGADDEITFSAPTKANSVGTLQEYNNRTIAGSVNWPYEMIMKDWRGVSFAGGRIILHGAKITTKVRQQLLIEVMLRPIWNQVVDEAVIVGAVGIDSRLYRDNVHLFRRHVWKGPKWSYAITPGEEVNAVVTAIDNNLMTLSDALAEDQQDFEQVMERRQVERQEVRTRNIVPNDVVQANNVGKDKPQMAAKAAEAPAPAPQHAEQEAEVTSAND